MTLPITKKKASRPPRIVVYGPPGCGKTTLAAAAAEKHNGLIIDTDGGSDELSDGIARITREHMKDWESFLAIVEEAASIPGGCLVIDSIDEAQALAATHVCNRDFGGDWGRKGFGNFGQGWAGTIEEMKKLQPADTMGRMKQGLGEAAAEGRDLEQGTKERGGDDKRPVAKGMSQERFVARVARMLATMDDD